MTLSNQNYLDNLKKILDQPKREIAESSIKATGARLPCWLLNEAKAKACASLGQDRSFRFDPHLQTGVREFQES